MAQISKAQIHTYRNYGVINVALRYKFGINLINPYMAMDK